MLIKTCWQQSISGAATSDKLTDFRETSILQLVSSTMNLTLPRSVALLVVALILIGVVDVFVIGLGVVPSIRTRVSHLGQDRFDLDVCMSEGIHGRSYLPRCSRVVV
jgi:hypothetical protein